jgi:hypothetical protein
MKFVVVNFCVRQNALLRKIADAWVGPHQTTNRTPLVGEPVAAPTAFE